MSRRFVARILTLCVATSLVALPLQGPAAAQDRPFRAFSAESYWNKALPLDAPRDAKSADYIEWLKADSPNDYIRLAGTESSGGWGEPIFWAKPGDPTYHVVQTRYTLPAQFASVRIPAEARVPATSDAQMTIYDLEAGAVYKLQKAVYNATTDTWSAGGGSYYRLDSNGLVGLSNGSDDARNAGHRGNPPAIHAVRWDEVQFGSIDHALKIAINTANQDHVWPMTGSDGDSRDPNAPPQGLRLRIRPDVNLSSLGLSPAAMVVARALKKYGAVVGDSSGSGAILKVENTVLEGRGYLWKGVLAADALSKIPFDMFEAVARGYNPPAGAAVEPDPLPEPEPEPSEQPTDGPTDPTDVPTDEPTDGPTDQPTDGPTDEPDPDLEPKRPSVKGPRDAYVDSRYAGGRYGGRARIRVADPKRGAMKGLVSFDVSGLEGRVRKATLKLFVTSANAGCAIHEVSRGWLEDEVSWRNSPRMGDVVVRTGRLTRGTWERVDVTAAIEGDGQVRFGITTARETLASFASKEWWNPRLAPQLIIETSSGTVRS